MAAPRAPSKNRSHAVGVFLKHDACCEKGGAEKHKNTKSVSMVFCGGAERCKMPVGAENKTRNVRYAVGCAEQGHGVTLGRTMRQNLYAARGYGAMKLI